MPWGVDVLESSWATGLVRQGISGDVHRVVVRHDAIDGSVRVVVVEAAKLGDEFDASITQVRIGDDFAGMQVRGGRAQRLHAGLLDHAARVDGNRARIENAPHGSLGRRADLMHVRPVESVAR